MHKHFKGIALKQLMPVSGLTEFEKLNPNLEYWILLKDKDGSEWVGNKRLYDAFLWILTKAINGLPAEIVCVLPIPTAPSWAKPLEYPINKPERIGTYVVHVWTNDSYKERYFDGDKFCISKQWRLEQSKEDIDYFIPILIEDLEEEQGESYINKMGDSENNDSS